MHDDASRLVLYVGCGNADGDLLGFSIDATTGALAAAFATSAGSSISFPLVHPSGRFLYVTNNRTDRLTAFSIDGESGALGALDEVSIAGAPGEAVAGPTYLSASRDGRFLLAANYRGHNVVVRALGEDGRFGAVTSDVAPGRHAHCIRLDPSGRFAFVPCLGSDLVAQYVFDGQTGRLTPNEPASIPVAAGDGPRHLTFHPSGRVAYLVGELGSSVTTLAFDDSRGTLCVLQRLSTVREGYQGRRWTSDLVVTPDGRFLLVCNRAEESLALFAIDPGTGTLVHVEHVALPGRTPRQMSLDPTGRLLFVALQDSDAVALFHVDRATGLPTLGAVTPLPASPYFALPWALPLALPLALPPSVPQPLPR